MVKTKLHLKIFIKNFYLKDFYFLSPHMPKNPISMVKLSKLRMLTVKFINIKKIEYDTFSDFSTKLSNIKDNWEMIHWLKVA